MNYFTSVNVNKLLSKLWWRVDNFYISALLVCLCCGWILNNNWLEGNQYSEIFRIKSWHVFFLMSFHMNIVHNSDWWAHYCGNFTLVDIFTTGIKLQYSNDELIICSLNLKLNKSTVKCPLPSFSACSVTEWLNRYGHQVVVSTKVWGW